MLKTKEVRSELDGLPLVSDFVKGVMTEIGCSKAMISSIDIAVEEVYVNIASYAYDEDAKSKPAWISCGAYDDELIIEFRDMGVPYDPLQNEDPVTGNPQEMSIGGYGIFMVKTIADSVSYQYDQEKKQNILLIKKKISYE